MTRHNDSLTVSDLLDKFISAKAKLVPRELSPKTLANYKGAAKTVDTVLGSKHLDKLAPNDFGRLRERFGKTHGLVALAQDITLVRVIFSWAYKSGYTDGQPRYGTEFNRPRKANLRKAQAARPVRLFSADEVRHILEATTGPLHAMTLLGINCAFGNSDIATLPTSAMNGAWVDYPRPKTGLPRRCPLWPETAEAVRVNTEYVATKVRPMFKPLKNPGLVFEPMWLSRDFTAVLRELNLYREGRSFYSLRHTFRTVADSLPDRTAINHIMGHAESDMGSHYRHGIDDSRLLAVAEHVRTWLFP